MTFETETWLKFRDRDFIKISKTRDLKLETETRDFKICAFCRIFFKKRVIASDLKFLQISDIFPTWFSYFLPANATNKKSLNYRNFNRLFFCNIQSRDLKPSRPRRDLKPSMPSLAKMGLETETKSRNSITLLRGNHDLGVKDTLPSVCASLTKRRWCTQWCGQEEPSETLVSPPPFFGAPLEVLRARAYARVFLGVKPPLELHILRKLNYLRKRD